MARPTKDGLDYFPLDVDIFEDEKIEAIAGEFGIKGELAVIKLLCAVYKKGYFCLIGLKIKLKMYGLSFQMVPAKLMIRLLINSVSLTF